MDEWVFVFNFTDIHGGQPKARNPNGHKKHVDVHFSSCHIILNSTQNIIYWDFSGNWLKIITTTFSFFLPYCIMTSLDGLKTMFEALLPDGVVTNPPHGPTWFERFGTTPKETASELCVEWKLTATQKVDFWYVWENHPTKLGRDTQQQGK
jgi:hypothetical protein